jgi:hypothetical protein
MPQRRVKLYARDDGPICYEANFFVRAEESSERFVRELLEMEYTSHWASVRTRPLPSSQTGSTLPRVRTLTRLDADTAQLLLADMTERNEDGYARELTILATKSDIALDICSFDGCSRSLEDFIRSQPGPLEMVYFQLDDSPNYFFVNSAGRGGIETLLAKQKLIPVEKECTFPYRKLGRVQIESTRNNILALAFPLDPRTKGLKRVP